VHASLRPLQSTQIKLIIFCQAACDSVKIGNHGFLGGRLVQLLVSDARLLFFPLRTLRRCAASHVCTSNRLLESEVHRKSSDLEDATPQAQRKVTLELFVPFQLANLTKKTPRCEHWVASAAAASLHVVITELRFPSSSSTTTCHISVF
jgi:hypothetical protein